MDIVMIGFAGQKGANDFFLQNRELLEKRFSQNALRQMNIPPLDFTDIKMSIDGRITFCERVTTDGVYSALWRLGTSLKKGLLVDNKKIPIKQTTIELCEALDENPYLIDGEGSYLLATEDGYALVRRLKREISIADDAIAVIGSLTKEKLKKVFYGEDEYRVLEERMLEHKKVKNWS